MTSPSIDATEVYAMTSHEDDAMTSSLTTPTPAPNLADIQWDRSARIITLWVQIVVGLVGGTTVCFWLWLNRRRKSRVNVILLHVTVSDLLVMVTALAQVVWEMADRHWLAGDFVCRVLKFYQSFSMIASSYMIVLLSVDRHQAIRAPLRSAPAVWKMALPCWLLAVVLSLPMFGLFRVNFIDDPQSQFYNMTVCESIYRTKPLLWRQVIITLVGVFHVFLPCIVIAVCYVRIFRKVAQKADEARGMVSPSNGKPGKIHLQSTRGSSLPKAKVKTLKMTVVIVTMFILCGLPYHLLELVYNFWRSDSMPHLAAAILGALPVANSVINPYIFLLFNVTCRCLRGVVRPNSRRPYTTAAAACVSKTDQTTLQTNIDTGVTSSAHPGVKYTDLISSDVELANIQRNGKPPQKHQYSQVAH